MKRKYRFLILFKKRLNNKNRIFNNIKHILTYFSFLIFVLIAFFSVYKLKELQSSSDTPPASQQNDQKQKEVGDISTQVLPKEGFTLPISWANLGPKLITEGVIDLPKFEKSMNLTEEEKNILVNGSNKPIVINSQNSQFIVDMLWAIGLAQKSNIYINGPMGTRYKKQQGNFASTGGWTLAKGKATEYLNKYNFIPLTAEQQTKVEEIAQNVYRPCCNNSSWFPDCNHGMAALAAIEMMVSANIPDAEIYQNVLKLNSFWFPTQYITTAVYFERQGIPWNKVDAKEVLGEKYSSSTGASDIANIVGPLPQNGRGGSCGA